MARITRWALVAALAALSWMDAPATPRPEAPRLSQERRTHHVKKRAKPRAGRARAAALVAPARAGLVVAWDPETGTFGAPSAEQRLLLTPSEERGLSRSFDGLLAVRHADGSVSVDLQGRFQEFAVVRLGPGGRPVFTCLDDSAAVRRALVRPLSAPSGLEER